MDDIKDSYRPEHVDNVSINLGGGEPRDLRIEAIKIDNDNKVVPDIDNTLKILAPGMERELRVESVSLDRRELHIEAIHIDRDDRDEDMKVIELDFDDDKVIEFERKGVLAAIARDESPGFAGCNGHQTSGRIALQGFDLDDVCATLRQQLGSERDSDKLTELHHPDACKWR